VLNLQLRLEALLFFLLSLVVLP
jgi:hypothetical protein